MPRSGVLLAAFLAAACVFPEPASANAEKDFVDGAARALSELRDSFARLLPGGAVRPAPKSGSTVLRVLTYNINGLPFEEGDGRHERYAKVGRILKRLRSEGAAPHIVAIQESFHPRTRELIEEADYPYFRLGAAGSSDSPLPSGLVILSEFPIEAAATVDYQRCMGWDCWANKGALHARIRVPGAPQAVDVYDTHMNADDGNDPAEAGEIRTAQIAQLVAFMGFTRSPGAPALFAADFNFRPGNADYAAFAAVPDIGNAAQRCLDSRTCAGDADPGGIWRDSVDHHFYLSGSRPTMSVEPVRIEQTFKETVDGGPLSDHLGLEIHYRINW